MTELAWPVFLNGRRLAPGEPALSVEDLGFTLGLAVFETLLHERGVSLFAEDHLQRLARGAAALGIAWRPGLDPPAALAQMEAALAGRTAVLRMTASRGVPREPGGLNGPGEHGTPTLVLTSRPHVAPHAAGVILALSSRVALEGDAGASLKSNNRIEYVLAREEALRVGAWEGLICTRAGDLCEGTVSNVFIVRGGQLATPSTARGCLAGTMRDRLLASLAEHPLRLAGGAALEVQVDRVEREELLTADEVFLTNTTGRIVPVREVRAGEEGGGGRVLRADLPGGAGRVARSLRERIDELEAAYRTSRGGR